VRAEKSITLLTGTPAASIAMEVSPMKNPRSTGARRGPKPAASLSAEAKKLWADLTREYAISDAGGLAILARACESLDAMRAAEALVREHGVCVVDRWGQLKTNPATLAARDARAGFLRALAGLRLDIEPLRDAPGRPPGSR
jgi:phage terminase small subunit